jgi:membrane protease YdiL (CAAX protease family)
MNVQPESLVARVEGSVAAAAVGQRLARAVVTTLVIGGYVAVGFAFGLSANAYLLLGIPITIAFQLLVARRPLRALWLRDGPAMRVTSRSFMAVILVAIAPAVIAVGGVRDGDPVLAMYGLAAMIGAVGAVYAVRAMDLDAARATVRASVINGAILVAVMVVFRLISGGFHGNLGGALATAIISVATYLPVVFVMEEVLFRGLLDPYLHGSTGGRDRASALYGSALWGLWHLPVMSIGLGLLTIPYLVAVHTALGYVLVSAWRRTRNLAAPGIAHAIADALRNAVAVL